MNRVLKTLVASVATVSLLGAPAIATIGVGPAGATTAVTSPVGKYTATITYGTTSFPTPLSVKATGKFNFTAGPKGTWTETSNVLHLTGKIKKSTFAFVIKQTGKNLGSATKQGTISVGGTQIGTWYAVRG